MENNENKDRALTYSILAHIRNSGDLAKGPLDIFIPLIKRTLSFMNKKNIYSGKSIIEIKEYADKMYSLDFPIPVLKTILQQISSEINTPEKTYFTIYKDNAFSILEYSFQDFEDIIDKKQNKISEIENLFFKFRETSELIVNSNSSIFKFIEKNKFSLSKYLSASKELNNQDFTIEAKFVSFFRNIPSVYETIRDIYIGSILASYIEYKTTEVKIDTELLFDTNFIVGLLDLNTPESTHTCQTLLKIAKSQGFKTRLLKDTIEETKALLESKSRNFDLNFLQRKINPEDIYNACDRRKLKKTDLERIADNLETEISKFGISVLFDTSKLKNEAKVSEEFRLLKKYRNTELAALHDAIAIIYVKKQRGKQIFDFEKVNCWFVNNSIYKDSSITFKPNSTFQPEIINADDLLNILWLSNPQTKSSITENDLAEIGLTSSITLTLNSNLPKSKIIKDLDDNIHKYANEIIVDADIIRVATRITNKQLTDIENLNNLADKNKEEFVKRLEAEAAKQKKIEEKRAKTIERILEEYQNKSNEFKSYTLEIDKNSKEIEEHSNKIENISKSKDAKIIQLETKLKQIENEKILNKWQRGSLINLVIFTVIVGLIILSIYYIFDWDNEKVNLYFGNKLKDIWIKIFLWALSIICSAFFLVDIYNRYLNHSNIENFKKGKGI